MFEGQSTIKPNIERQTKSKHLRKVIDYILIELDINCVMLIALNAFKYKCIIT